MTAEPIQIVTARTEADPETGGAWGRERIILAQELEDAWEWAKRLEKERNDALVNKKAFEQAYSRAAVRLSRMVQGISNLLWSEEGKDMPLQVQDELRRLIAVGDPVEPLS